MDAGGNMMLNANALADTRIHRDSGADHGEVRLDHGLLAFVISGCHTVGYTVTHEQQSTLGARGCPALAGRRPHPLATLVVLDDDMRPP